MKFACERCGKRFASVDDPRPGRVYRIRCRCGNVVVVKAPPGGDSEAATRARGSSPREARKATRHAPVSRPRPPPLPARAAPAEPSPPVIELDPLPTPPASAPAPAPATEPARAVEPGGEANAPAAAVTPTPDAPTRTPPIRDDPFLRAAEAEAAAGAVAPTPAEALALELRPQAPQGDAEPEETPVELSRSESYEVAAPRRRTFAVAAAIVAAAVAALLLALRR